MAEYGAKELLLRNFYGVAPQLDPAELPPGIMANSLDVDFDGEQVKRRLGVARYNSVDHASPIDGVGLFYLAGGTNPWFVVASATKVYTSNRTEGITDWTGAGIDTLATGSQPMDFWFWRSDLIYYGNGVDTVRKSTIVLEQPGTSVVVAPITAPAAAPTLTPLTVQADHFDSGAWTLSGGASTTTAYDTAIKRQGTGSLKMTLTAAAAVGQFIYRAWSLGATVDLSEVDKVSLWVRSSQPGVQVQIGVYDNAESTLSAGPTWGRFPVVTVPGSNTWYVIEVPLGDIAPSARTASPGLAIRFVGDGGRGYAPNIDMWFDDARLQADMTPDEYEIRYTYATVDANLNVLRESAPSAAAKIVLDAKAPFKGINVGVTASGDGTVNKLHLYLYRTNGFQTRSRRVQQAANSTATLTITKSDGDVALDAVNGTAPGLILYRNAPPIAKTYCIVNRRLLAGNIPAEGENRLYISAFNDPEAFAPNETPGVDDPSSAGWIDLPRSESIVRIMEFEEMAIIFTSRSIYSLQGSGWDNFNLQKRASVGLDSRWGVVHINRQFYFISVDGIRVLEPNHVFEGDFQTWLISEPVGDLLRNIPTKTFQGNRRQKVALGVDERGRIHVAYASTVDTYNDAGLVFDPAVHPACLNREYTPGRPGWMRYSGWNYKIFYSLQFSAQDRGQMIGVQDSAVGIIYLIHQHYVVASTSTEPILDTTLAWSVTGPAFDLTQGRLFEIVYTAADMDGTALGTAIMDRGGTTAISVALAAATRGSHTRVAGRARWVQPGVASNGTKTSTVVRSFGVGYYSR